MIHTENGLESITDLEGNRVTYTRTAIAHCSGLQVAPATGLVSWTPLAGSHNVTLTVSDSAGGQASQSWELVVRVNQATSSAPASAAVGRP